MRLHLAALLTVLSIASITHAQDAPGSNDGPAYNPPAQRPAPIERTPAPDTQPQPSALPAPPPYDPAIFSRLIPPAQLTPFLQADGATTEDVFRDHQTRKLILSAIPNDIFRYGRDVSLPDTITLELDKSPIPARVHDNRYVLLTGNDTAKEWIRHDARTLIWIDTKEGIILGAFFFHPTNGEPGPTVTIFTRQIKQESIAFSELPPAFLDDLARWEQSSGIGPTLITYFIGDISKKFLLEHDLDYCTASVTVGGYGSDCEQFNADAADNDLTAALYLQQVNYATNATAYMINNPDQANWLVYRNRTCTNGPNPLACQIRLTRTRIAVVTRTPIRRR